MATFVTSVSSLVYQHLQLQNKSIKQYFYWFDLNQEHVKDKYKWNKSTTKHHTIFTALFRSRYMNLIVIIQNTQTYYTSMMWRCHLFVTNIGLFAIQFNTVHKCLFVPSCGRVTRLSVDKSRTARSRIMPKAANALRQVFARPERFGLNHQSSMLNSGSVDCGTN